MGDAILPLEYLNTNFLCRWRFLLSGNVESDVSLVDILNKSVKELKSKRINKWRVKVLTKVKEDLHILSTLEVNKAAGTAYLRAHSDEFYMGSNYQYPHLYSTLSYVTVSGALGAIAMGGVEDARRGMSYPKEYQEYIREAVPDNLTLKVNDWEFFKFDASTYLLSAVVSTILIEEDEWDGNLMPMRDIVNSEACLNCPFAELCSVSRGGGMIWRKGDDLEYAVGAALYLDEKRGDGWYLLYRTALRMLNYKYYNLKKALRKEMKDLYGEVIEPCRMEEIGEIVKSISKEVELTGEEKDLLEQLGNDFLISNDVFIDYEIYITTKEMNSLAEKGVVKLLGMEKRDGSHFIKLAPGPVFLKHLWGDA